MNVKLIIAYDGYAYKGWQKTHAGPSIELTLQQAIELVLQIPIKLQAASRTDAGVHAQGQVVNFIIPHRPLDLAKFAFRLNKLLPRDITVLGATEAEPDFHPTLSSHSKEYHYYVCYKSMQLPQHRFYSWHCPCPLNLEAMHEASKIMIGIRDFTSFCNKQVDCRYSDFSRDILAIEIEEITTERLRFMVRGHSFLYRMVRNMIGTLIYVGRGKIDPLDLPNIMSARDRRQAGITAPAHGLFLHQIYY